MSKTQAQLAKTNLLHVSENDELGKSVGRTPRPRTITQAFTSGTRAASPLASPFPTNSLLCPYRRLHRRRAPQRMTTLTAALCSRDVSTLYLGFTHSATPWGTDEVH